MSLPTPKHVLLIVTGGIAAYKALEVVRRLSEAGAAVRVVMTPAAQRFVTPLSFQALSGEPVHCDLLDERAEAAMGHIELARWADIVVVAPASADFLARLRGGLADDLASTLCLATTAPLLVAPAMNQQMWQNAATVANLAVLRERGIAVVGPADGAQACGETGPGRLVEPDDIAAAALAHFEPPLLAHTRIIVTAGPTQEAIDPVRYISNRSSGKMGYAVAAAAAAAGSEVTLVSGPTALQPPRFVTVLRVISAAEMFDAVASVIDGADIFISAAAALSLTLTPTQDILHSVTARPNPPFAVGFAAETDNLIANARSKLERKSLDMIAANIVGVEGVGFDSNDNELHVLWNGGEARLARAPKVAIARQLIALVADRYHANG
jgi:phosphopantothenoylcysteine decarboxylase/phosphopantothenate--cysteine ligase